MDGCEKCRDPAGCENCKDPLDCSLIIMDVKDSIDDNAIPKKTVSQKITQKFNVAPLKIQHISYAGVYT